MNDEWMNNWWVDVEWTKGIGSLRPRKTISLSLINFIEEWKEMWPAGRSNWAEWTNKWNKMNLFVNEANGRWRPQRSKSINHQFSINSRRWVNWWNWLIYWWAEQLTHFLNNQHQSTLFFQFKQKSLFDWEENWID